MLSSRSYVGFRPLKMRTMSFSEYCVDIASLNNFADSFRSTFIGKNDNKQVYKLITKTTLEEHRTYTENILLNRSKEVPAKMSRKYAEELLDALRKMSLTSLIKQFSGVDYEAI